MEAVLENPVIKDDDFDAALRAAAEQADRGEDITLPSTPKDETRAPVEPEATAEETSSTDTTPERTDARPRDELGRFTKTEAGEDIPASDRLAPTPGDQPDIGDKGETKPESAYAKAQKDQERLNRNRQEFEAEKAQEREALARGRAEIEQARAELARAKAEREQPQQQAEQISAQKYAEFAAEATRKAQAARKIGDDVEADEQMDLAAKATQAALGAHEREQTQAWQQASTQSEKAWEGEMIERIRQEPELAQKDSPLAKETMAVMSQVPGLFERIPPIRMPDGKIMGGFSFAAEHAKLRIKAGAVSVLETENKQLKAEVARLNGLTGLNGGGPTEPISAQTFESMSPDAQMAHIRQQAQRIDAGY